ncbi:DUF1648 domain-containing protein [Hymenobacter convexus]|uniref:DUF1648 domain-containing protein n=1 Tax=Hymenobacter sp. CA1UV-4 TaxID=3063782 RepID=UPI002712DAF1|nr:DUF1648 domain-containing protein [Hymenobacter sp. CA1UV-4]MDO7853401.1 DUF1648 domain-containing protein [Hymenobacter sp. CA1UV-4]
MESRPKIEVPQTPADKAADVAAWGALAALWALTTWYLFRLPDTIPIHFNAAGEPDRYDEKGTLAVLSLMATALFAAMTVVANAVGRNPRALNYPVTITPANALGQYRGAIRVARSLRIGFVLVFVQLLYQTAQVATGQAKGLGTWSMPIDFGLLLALPGLWYWWTVARN